MADVCNHWSGPRQAGPGASLASQSSQDGEPPGSDSQDKVGGAGERVQELKAPTQVLFPAPMSPQLQGI